MRCSKYRQVKYCLGQKCVHKHLNIWITAESRPFSHNRTVDGVYCGCQKIIKHTDIFRLAFRLLFACKLCKSLRQTWGVFASLCCFGGNVASPRSRMAVRSSQSAKSYYNFQVFYGRCLWAVTVRKWKIQRLLHFIAAIVALLLFCFFFTFFLPFPS